MVSPSMLASTGVNWAQVLVIVAPTLTALTALLKFSTVAIKQVRELLENVDVIRVQLAKTRQEVQAMNIEGTRPLREIKEQLRIGSQPVKEIAQKVEEVKEKVESTNGGTHT